MRHHCYSFALVVVVVLSVASTTTVIANNTSNGNEKATTSTNNPTNSSTNSEKALVPAQEESCSARVLREGIAFRDVHRAVVASKVIRFLEDYQDLDVQADDYFESMGVLHQNTKYYESGIDAAIVTRYDAAYCLAAFRGTTKFDMKDWVSNINVSPVEYNPPMRSSMDEEESDDAMMANTTTANDESSYCDLHEGYHDSYVDFEYRTDIEAFLQNCTSSCPTCSIVLTGHSQGGGIAEVAALYLKNHEVFSDAPIHVVTFGAPRALGQGCLEAVLLEQERCLWYHYVMARAYDGFFLGNNVVYDPVPILFSRYLDAFYNNNANDARIIGSSFARHGGMATPGHTIVLHSGDPHASFYMGFDGNPTSNNPTNIRMTDLPVDVRGNAHDYKGYEDALATTLEVHIRRGDSVYYLPVNGFSVGAVCNQNHDMCGTGTECTERQMSFWEQNWEEETTGASTCQPLPNPPPAVTKEKEKKPTAAEIIANTPSNQQQYQETTQWSSSDSWDKNSGSSYFVSFSLGMVWILVVIGD